MVDVPASYVYHLDIRMSKQRIYLDYASTTPVDPRVLSAMKPYFSEIFGNPGSLHSFGQAASAAVFAARQTVAKALNTHYNEVVFTASATEANNLAIRGALKATGKKEIIISAIEHESVLNTAKELEKEGFTVKIIPVLENGVVDLKKLKAALSENTALVSVMLANNEIGVIQPLAEIATIVREFRGKNQWPLLHTDAVQALQYITCDISTFGLDVMTLSSQKIYGPKGVGALYIRTTMKGVNRLYPIAASMHGGGQEQGMRSGTENVPAIVGFAKAVELIEQLREKETIRVRALRDELFGGMKKIFPKAQMNGDQMHRLPNNLNVYIPGVSGEQLLVSLDLEGIAVSSGSACSARSIDPSHVLLAMGYDAVRAKNSIRITLGRMTTRQEITAALKVFAALKKSVVK